MLDNFAEIDLNIFDGPHNHEEPMDPVIHLQFSTNIKIQNCSFFIQKDKLLYCQNYQER